MQRSFYKFSAQITQASRGKQKKEHTTQGIKSMATTRSLSAIRQQMQMQMEMHKKGTDKRIERERNSQSTSVNCRRLRLADKWQTTGANYPAVDTDPFREESFCSHR